MIRKYPLVDLSLGAATVLFLCALAWMLHARTTAVPKVLAQSTNCPTTACTAGAARKVTEEGYTFDETCSGYPLCNWVRRTVDPIVQTNNPYCCLSNGSKARCLMLRTGEACLSNTLETDARLFASIDENNQRACEIQRASGVCNPVSSSSQSSSVASCGNNVREPSNGEECDWASNNSDTLPNRCRKNCRYPTCGDGKVDDNFSDPASGTSFAEECDNMEFVVDGVRYPAVTAEAWALNRHTYCGSDCRVKQSTNPLFFMFPKTSDSTAPVYFVRNIFDWNSIFFPLSSLGF